MTAREPLDALLPHRVKDIPEIDVPILIGALETPDLETIQETTGLGGRDAARLLIKFQESKTGYKTRDQQTLGAFQAQS